MYKIKTILLLLILLINSIINTGCWNYREVDKFSIVAGVAIDKGKNNQFQMTVEIIEISSGAETKMTSKIITDEGKTLFDTARNLIAIVGKRLYWSHAKVIILSKEIVSENIVEAIDWYNRDAETREDIQLLISDGKSAKEIFEGQGTTEDIKSLVLDEILANQASLSKAPITDMLTLDMQLVSNNNSIVLPLIKLIEVNKKMVPQIDGTAIIKNNKLIGTLNGEETMTLIFIKNEIKGGILVEKMQLKDVTTPVSLEIYKNKTKVSPVNDGDKIKMNIDIDTTVAIGEIVGVENFIDEAGSKKLIQNSEIKLKERIEALIKKVQSEYDADIFGFGTKLRESKPKVWKSASNNWESIFKDLKVDIKTKVTIKNSGVLSKTFMKGK